MGERIALLRPPPSQRRAFVTELSLTDLFDECGTMTMNQQVDDGVLLKLVACLHMLRDLTSSHGQLGMDMVRSFGLRSVLYGSAQPWGFFAIFVLAQLLAHRASRRRVLRDYAGRPEMLRIFDMVFATILGTPVEECEWPMHRAAEHFLQFLFTVNTWPTTMLYQFLRVAGKNAYVCAIVAATRRAQKPQHVRQLDILRRTYDHAKRMLEMHIRQKHHFLSSYRRLSKVMVERGVRRTRIRLMKSPVEYRIRFRPLGAPPPDESEPINGHHYTVKFTGDFQSPRKRDFYVRLCSRFRENCDMCGKYDLYARLCSSFRENCDMCGKPELQQCDVCHERSSALKQCGTCRMRQYCSRRCQKKDWNGHHRTECAKLDMSMRANA